MSAPFRYARILNGLSFLISRRSAISRRIRAMAGLSKQEPFGLDVVIEHARTPAGERFGDSVMHFRRTIAEQAAAPAGPAHLRRRGAGSACPRDEVLDRRGRDARRKPLPVVPLDRNLPADLVPIPAL